MRGQKKDILVSVIKSGGGAAFRLSFFSTGLSPAFIGVARFCPEERVRRQGEEGER